MKQCSRCKKDFPATREYFYSCKDCKNGLYPQCKKCKLEKTKLHNAKPETKARKAIYRKQYYEKNREKKLAYFKEWRKKNKEKKAAYAKEYNKKNKERMAAWYKAYREKNKERILLKDKEYRDNNKEKRSLYEKMYRQTDRGKNNRYAGSVRYRTRQHKKKFTRIERTEILNRDDWTCQLCGIKVHDECIDDWNTPNKAHIDHIIPLSKGGHSELNNLQTLCRTCNISKGDKLLQEVNKNA